MNPFDKTVGQGIGSLLQAGHEDVSEPGAFNFAPKSEPVLRMARGGEIPEDTSYYEEPDLSSFFAPAPATTAAPLTLDASVYSMTPTQKAAYYNTLLGQGYSDAAIRAAAGSQTDSDWAALQSIARGLTTTTTTTAAPVFRAPVTTAPPRTRLDMLMDELDVMRDGFQSGAYSESDFRDILQAINEERTLTATTAAPSTTPSPLGTVAVTTTPRPDVVTALQDAGLQDTSQSALSTFTTAAAATTAAATTKAPSVNSLQDAVNQAAARIGAGTATGSIEGYVPPEDVGLDGLQQNIGGYTVSPQVAWGGPSVGGSGLVLSGYNVQAPKTTTDKGIPVEVNYNYDAGRKLTGYTATYYTGSDSGVIVHYNPDGSVYSQRAFDRSEAWRPFAGSALALFGSVLAPGLASALGGGLAGTAGAGAILGGAGAAISGAEGSDILKAAAVGGAGSIAGQVASGLGADASKLVGGGTLGDIASGAVRGAVGSVPLAIATGDASLIGKGAVTGGTSAGITAGTKALDLPVSQQQVVAAMNFANALNSGNTVGALDAASILSGSPDAIAAARAVAFMKAAQSGNPTAMLAAGQRLFGYLNQMTAGGTSGGTGSATRNAPSTVISSTDTIPDVPEGAATASFRAPAGTFIDLPDGRSVDERGWVYDKDGNLVNQTPVTGTAAPSTSTSTGLIFNPDGSFRADPKFGFVYFIDGSYVDEKGDIWNPDGTLYSGSPKDKLPSVTGVTTSAPVVITGKDGTAVTSEDVLPTTTAAPTTTRATTTTQRVVVPVTTTTTEAPTTTPAPATTTTQAATTTQQVIVPGSTTTTTTEAPTTTQRVEVEERTTTTAAPTTTQKVEVEDKRTTTTEAPTTTQKVEVEEKKTTTTEAPTTTQKVEVEERRTTTTEAATTTQKVEVEGTTTTTTTLAGTTTQKVVVEEKTTTTTTAAPTTTQQVVIEGKTTTTTTTPAATTTAKPTATTGKPAAATTTTAAPSFPGFTPIQEAAPSQVFRPGVVTDAYEVLFGPGAPSLMGFTKAERAKQILAQRREEEENRPETAYERLMSMADRDLTIDDLMKIIEGGQGG